MVDVLTFRLFFRRLSSIHVPDMLPTVSNSPLAPMWRDRVKYSEATNPSERDRDIKLLAWLEYAEIMAEGVYTFLIFF